MSSPRKTDGSGETPLFAEAAEGPAWSPDGRHVSVAVQNSQGLIFVAVARPDGSDWRVLKSPDASSNLGCSAWSPDSSRLACEAWDDTNPARNGIYTVRSSDGGDLKRVTSSPDGGHDGPGSYSPDGSQIVFIRSGASDPDHGALMSVNVDGSGTHLLTDRTVGLTDRWSPDGKTILSEQNGSLLLVPVGGGAPSSIAIAGNLTIYASRGDWSPDGRWIVFSGRTTAKEDIFIMQSDGTNLHQITNTPSQDEEFGGWEISPK
jgi:Tol biopolymer transport system component